MRLILLACLGCLAPAAHSQTWLESTSGERVRGRLVSVQAEQAHFEVAGESRVWPLGELLLVRAAPDATPGQADTGPRTDSGASSAGSPAGTPAPAGAVPLDGSPDPSEAAPPSVSTTVVAPSRDLVWLAGPAGTRGPGRDRLAGEILGGDDFGLTLKLTSGRTLELSFDVIERVLPQVDRPLDLLAALEGGGFDDRVWRRRDDGSMDGISGVLSRVDGRQLVLESALGDLTLPFEQVLAVVLAETEQRVGDRQGWPCRVSLAGGSVFDAGLLGLEQDIWRLDTGFAGVVELPGSLVQTVLLGPDGEHAPRELARMQPLEVFEWTRFGADEPVLFPWRAELGVAGVPLRLGGVLAASGLGVHAQSKLVFEVPTGVSALRVTLGLTDDVNRLPARGSVGFELRVDGELRGARVPMQGGDAPVSLRLADLRPGQQLELLVDDGGDDEAGDRAAWADAVFLP